MTKNPDIVSQLPDGWESTTVGESFHVIGGGTPSTEKKEYWEGKIPWISSADISGENSITPRRYITQDAIINSATSLIPSGSIIVVTRVGLGKVALANFPLCISQDSQGLISQNPKIDTKFVLYFLSQAAKSFEYQGRGTTVSGITKKELKELFLPVPPILEQQRITQILSTWDHAIERVQRLIEAKLQLRKELIQGLLTGRMRFPEFGLPLLQNEELPEGWHFMKIGKLVKRVKRPVKINPDQIYQEIGIRSHGKGIFHKEECLGKEIGTKSIFWVKPNTFVLNIVFAWEQAISRTTIQEEGMVASHRFPMYQPVDDLLDLDYLVNFFLTRRGKSLLGLVSPGGAGRNKTLNQDAFSKLDIPVPPIGEQKRISSIIYDFDREIRILIRYNNVLINQKRALMQKLLTGEIRVKVN